MKRKKLASIILGGVLVVLSPIPGKISRSAQLMAKQFSIAGADRRKKYGAI